MKMSGLSAIDFEPDYLNAGAGMVSTVLNLGKFDVAMDRNLIVSEESKEMIFSPTVSKNGHRLPYGMGWFVQEHRGSKIVWHYGWAPDAYSSLILKVPEEEVTLILLANSDDASASFNLGAGNVLTSPFAVTFISQFTDIAVALGRIFTYSNEKYELSVYPNGEFFGKPEEAFIVSASVYISTHKLLLIPPQTVA